METKIPQIILIIITCGVIQNIILAVSILSQLQNMKDIKKAITFLMCLLATIFFLLPILMEYYNISLKAIICVPFIACIGPLYYISLQSVIKGENRLLLKDVLHLIPALMLAFFVVILSANNFIDNLLMSVTVFHAAGYFFTSMIYLAKQLPGKIAGENIDIKIKMRLVLNVLFAICFLMAGAGLLINFFLYLISAALSVVLVLVSYIISLRYPLKIDYYKNIKNRMFFTQLLPETDPEKLKEELNNLLLSDNIYKEDLTLPKLAATLGIKTYQLSHFINNYIEMSFADFINTYRVEDAKKKILTSQDVTILNIAYESGFNSKASFNRAFKKFTGLTPSDFRNINK